MKCEIVTAAGSDNLKQYVKMKEQRTPYMTAALSVVTVTAERAVE